MLTGNGSDEQTLEYTFKYNPPMDPVVGERNLKEIGTILDELGVVFLLSSGTCLGAVRDKGFIPWDDDVDLISVVGINGLTEETVLKVFESFRQKGYFVYLIESEHSTCASTVKDYARISWEAMRITDNHVKVYPGKDLPVDLFSNPKPVDFLGQTFLVPNPPEEYLRLKYGEEWMIPKKAGEYEKDIIANMPSANLPGTPSRIRVLDESGKPVADADVIIAGGVQAKTNDTGYAEVTLPPDPNWYAVVIRYPGHEQILYMEELEPNRTYIYHPNNISNIANQVAGPVGTVGHILTLE